MNRPSLFILFAIIIFCLFIAACVSPYQGHADALKAAYQSGQITADQYFSQMGQLEALELQRRQAVSQAFFQAGQSFKQQQPRNTFGTIYTPSGGMYQYNSTTY